MSEQKPTPTQTKSPATKWLMKKLSSKRGMALLEFMLKAKSKSDTRLSEIFHLAGLPSLQDKSEVERAIRRQKRRLRDLTFGLDELDDAIKRLENTLSQAATTPPPPPATVVPLRIVEPGKPLISRAKSTKKAKAKPKRPAAKKVTKAPAPAKPRPLGAARKAAPPTSSRSLLDLNFKKR